MSETRMGASPGAPTTSKIETDPVVVAPAVAATLAQAERILLLSHINPDGDAIGTMLGLWHILRAMGKSAVPLASSSYPDFCKALPGIEHVQVYERGTALPAADLTWMVDTADLARVGPVYEDHAAELTSRPLIIVDHHATNVGGGTINLVDEHAASAAELLYWLMAALRAPLPAEAATCLLLGITTDTQSFQTNSTRPTSLRAAANLLEAGADQQAVVQHVFFATPYGTARLMGAALSQLVREGGLLWLPISQQMMQETGAEDGAYDEVLAVVQRVAGARICALFKEREDGQTKLSLRSQPDIDVSLIARTWGGGGHRQAAGATLQMDLAAAQQAVLPLLRARLQG